MTIEATTRHILMIAPEPFFEPRGTPFSVYWRLKALSSLGYQVDLLTYPVGREVQIAGVRIIRIGPRRFIRQIPVGPSWKKLFLDVLLFAKAVQLLCRNRYLLLHTHEEASFFGIVLAKTFRIRHLYDMHSSLPQQLRNFEFTRFRPLMRLFEWLERRVIGSTDAVISICPALEEHVNRLNGHSQHMMIENVAGDGAPRSVPEEEVRQFENRYSLRGGRIVLYAGTLEAYQGIDLLITSAVRIVKECKDVMFLIMGGTSDQVRSYQNQVNRLGLAQNFRLLGVKPPSDVFVAIRLAHVLVSPRINGTNTPLKIYSYLQSGKPIVATNIFSHTQVLNEASAVLVDPEPDAFARGVLSVLANPDLAGQLAAAARDLFDSRYSYQQFVAKTDQIMRLAVS